MKTANDIKLVAVNAPDPVRLAAKHVCPFNEEDGVLVTLEKIFGLN